MKGAWMWAACNGIKILFGMVLALIHELLPDSG